MKHDLLNMLACPNCKHSLDLKNSENKDGEVLSGELVCGDCNSSYEIADGVPDLRPYSTESSSSGNTAR